MRLLICTQTVDTQDPLLGFFHDWILDFSKHFEHVYVICLKEGEHHLPYNVTVYSLGKESGAHRGTYLMRFYRFFSHVFFKERVRFVFFHMGSIYNVLALPFFLVRNFFNTKFYWWKVHGHLNLLGKLAYRVSDAVYTATESTFPHTGRKKRVVGHAVLLPTPIKPKEAFATPLRLLSVGRVMPSKHLEVSIHVIRLLRDAGIEAHLSIVGPYSDPVYYAELTALIEKYDLQEQVVFLGPKTHDALPSFYGESDILIHPSTTGGIDKVVLEAMVYGVIPVCLHTPYKSILDPSLCVEENTPALYVDCITALRNREKASIIELRRTLEDEVREHHSLDTLTSRIFGTIGT